MKFRELKKSLTDNVYPVYLIEGEDAFFRERSLKLIKDKCVQNDDFNYSCFEGNDIIRLESEILSSLNSCPFMSDRRMVVLRDYYPMFSEQKREIFKYFSSPNEYAVFVILNTSTNDVLEKTENVTVVDCGKADTELVELWVKNAVKEKGLTIDDDAIKKLYEYCNADMARINGETEKLIAYCYDAKTVTATDVENNVGKETDYKVYEIVDFIAKKNYEKAFSSLTEFLDKQTDKQRIFISLYTHFRRLLFTSLSKGNNKEIAEKLGVKEYAIKMAREQTKYFTPKKLKNIVDKLTEYDSSFKSGKTSLDSAIILGVFKAISGK